MRSQKRTRKIFYWIKPRYDELTVFHTAMTTILVLINYPEVLELLTKDFETTPSKGTGTFCILGILAVIGMVLSFVHIFTTRRKGDIEKTIMGVFVLVANGTAGIAAGMEVFPERWSIFAFFPLWNLLTGMLLVYSIGFVDDSVVSDRDATFLESFLGTITLFLVYYIASFWLRLSWTMTFSICMVYSSLVIVLVRNLLAYVRMVRG